MDEKRGEKTDKEIRLGEILKKVASLGVGAAFMTEDAVKNVVGELPLPKDLLSGLLQNAKNTKNDFVSATREEVSKVLKGIDWMKVSENIFEKFDININAKISFSPKKTSSQKKVQDGA